MTKPIKHKHLAIQAWVKNPPRLPDKMYLSEWAKNLINDIDMKLLGGPYIEYVDTPGNVGLTMVCMIETSHIAMHIWDEKNEIQFDVYSCADFDPKAVLDHLSVFQPYEYDYMFWDREDGFKLIDEGHWEKTDADS